MSAARDAVLVTGATGLVGFGVVRTLLDTRPDLDALVLVRNVARWQALASRLGPLAARVRPVTGDVTAPDLGLRASDRATLRARSILAVHAAADTRFARPLADARATNAAGTGHVLACVAACPRLERIVHVSTTYVCGRRHGVVLEADNGEDHGWVNGYEQSKYEAEALVRASGLPYVIVRPSTIVCDTVHGAVSQLNAVHHTLRLWYDGLVPLMPGTSDTPADVVPLDVVSGAIVHLAVHPDARGATVHLAGGAASKTVGEIVALAWELWGADPTWGRRAIPQPALVDLPTYRLFEQSVCETGDAHLQRIVRSLERFAPQLAYPKRFDTTRARALLRDVDFDVNALWHTVLHHTAARATSEAAA